MQRIFKFLILLLIPIKLFSQDLISNYSIKDFDFVGYIEDIPVFRYVYKYHNIGNIMPLENASQWGLYSIKNNECIDFYLYQEVELNLGRTYFAKDEIRIYWDYNNKNKLKIKTGSLSYDVLLGDNLIKKPVFSFYENNIIYSTSLDDFLYIIEIKEEILCTKIPLLGIKNYILGGYLYFDYHHIDKNKVTPCPVDLYRVKIGDWNNPELLAEFISNSWLPLNDSIVLMTLPIKGRGRQVFYNIKNKTYVETEKKLSTIFIKYESKEYLLDTERDNDGNKKYVLQPLPKIPTKGYVKDNQREILPRVLHVNLSNQEKQFSNTFITDKLLYEASEAELNKFSKKELRILRNAFYARRGYKFKSNDLKEFFIQFEWYNQLLESNEFFEISNEDVVISPKDKERVDLIKEIEKSK